MRLPGSIHTFVTILRPARASALAVLCVCAACWLTPQSAAQYRSSADEEQERLHETEQWRQIQAHLPDPATATVQELEQQGDILRARRFPEDAMEFYKYAMARGGNQASLLNKLGLTELEMRNTELARAYFKHAVKLAAKDAEAWNNLGAVEYVDHGAESAVTDYKRAIKLNKREAVFHANLATAYFETKDFGGARREMAMALKLDPEIFDKPVGTGGVEAHVLTSEDRARFAYEMAKLYARDGQPDQMLHSLAMACEAGMDVQREMHRDPLLAQFENDPRVVVLVHNAQMMRSGRAATVSASSNGGAVAAPAEAKPLAE